jgi:hypothetical protein
MEDVTNAYKLWSENLKGRDHSEDLEVDKETISEWILGETGWEGVDWIHLSQNRAFVNTVMNFRIP